MNFREGGWGVIHKFGSIPQFSGFVAFDVRRTHPNHGCPVLLRGDLFCSCTFLAPS